MKGNCIDVYFCENGEISGRAITYVPNQYVKRYFYVRGLKHGPFRHEEKDMMMDT
jgi:hypothetical protein